MTVTITLAQARPNWLRYLVDYDGGVATTGAITTTGAATPDLRTDSPQGPIHLLSKTFDTGYGQFAAGAQTQAKARALWLSDWSGADPGNDLITTARCRVTRRSGLVDTPVIDANVDGGGNPTITIACPGGDPLVFYLDVEVPQGID